MKQHSVKLKLTLLAYAVDDGTGRFTVGFHAAYRQCGGITDCNVPTVSDIASQFGADWHDRRKAEFWRYLQLLSERRIDFDI